VRQLLAAAVVALACCPVAAAHGDGAARGFRSTVEKVTPALRGLSVRVLDADDELQLRNETGRTIVIMGYDGEPYLRFSPDGVFRNARSPASYLNLDRYAKVDLPGHADSKAPPRWERVASGAIWSWHDHRIHWMSPIDPPRVRANPDRPHHVFDWKVPAQIEGDDLAIRGSLDYSPPEDGGTILPLVLAATVGVATTCVAGFVLLRRRRRGPSRFARDVR
jgi:hypothetical protein